jgi:hypothetical protein
MALRASYRQEQGQLRQNGGLEDTKAAADALGTAAMAKVGSNCWLILESIAKHTPCTHSPLLSWHRLPPQSRILNDWASDCQTRHPIFTRRLNS